MKKIIALVVALLMVVALAACAAPAAPATDAPATEAPATEAPKTEAPATEAPATAEAPTGEKKLISVIIKATDSDFWQQLVVGAKNFEFENKDAVTVEILGPPSESDIDKQVEITEQCVTKKPDAILIASTSSDACNNAIDSAAQAGIPLITVDNKVTTDTYITHLATDNYTAGGKAAERFVKELQDRGVELKGKLGLVTALSGVQVLVDRVGGFVDKLKEIAPDIECLEEVYVDNDIPKAQSAAENIYTANKADLIGFYASNNATGDGVVNFMTENNLGSSLVLVTFDSDKLEIDGIKNGQNAATVIQDPYGMGYKGCTYLYQIITGEKKAEDFKNADGTPGYEDTGVNIVDLGNVESDEMKGVIDPFSLKKYE